MGVLKAKVSGSWVEIPGIIGPSSSGLESAKPATPTYSGLQYFATDTARLWLWDGTGWIIEDEPNQAWTPSLSGLTVGDGSWISATTSRAGGWCDLQGVFLFGTTSAVTGDLRMTLPFNCLFDNVAFYRAHALQYGANEHPLFIANNLNNTFSMRAINTAGATATQSVCSASVPFTWNANCQLYVAGRYPMSTGYS